MRTERTTSSVALLERTSDLDENWRTIRRALDHHPDTDALCELEDRLADLEDELEACRLAASVPIVLRRADADHFLVLMHSLCLVLRGPDDAHEGDAQGWAARCLALVEDVIAQVEAAA